MRLNRRANHLMKISWIQLRTLLVFALILAYTSAYLSQGYQVRQTYQIALNAWGTFACTMNNTKILLVCFAGYVLLLSDLPCFQAVHMYEMVRSKRREIMAVRVLFVLKTTLLYLLCLFLLFSLLGGCSDLRVNTWDKLHFSLARGQTVDGIHIDAPASVVLHYTPMGAFALNTALLFLVFSGLGMGLLLLTMLFPVKKAIFAALCIWGGLDMAVDEMGLGYRMYIASPLSYTRLEILGAHVTNGYYPSLAQIALAVSLLFFGTLLGCLLFPVARRFNRLSLK